MAALRISMGFLGSVLLSTFAIMVMPSAHTKPEETQHQASINTIKPFSEVLADAKPCGYRADAPASQQHETLASTTELQPHSTSSTQIRMSRPLRARDLPGIVKLEPEYDLAPDEISKGHCSATRIADGWFLTAAHCLSSGYDRIVLKVGSESLISDNIRTIPVDYAVCHAGFRGQNNRYENDLSLLHISDDYLNDLTDVPVIEWGATREPFSVTQFRSARVGGWGLKTYGGELNDHLQKMELDILHIDDRRIRLSSRAGRGPCVGDSGGPLMVEEDGKPVLMGVLSTITSNQQGEMCSGQYFSNYTNLSGYRSWAYNTMAVCDATDGRCKAG